MEWCEVIEYTPVNMKLEENRRHDKEDGSKDFFIGLALKQDRRRK